MFILEIKSKIKRIKSKIPTQKKSVYNKSILKTKRILSKWTI